MRHRGSFATAAPLVTDASSAEGVYVGITRGQFDLQAVVIRRREVVTPIIDDDLPVLHEETTSLAATERHLGQNSPERLASEYQRIESQEVTGAVAETLGSKVGELPPHVHFEDADLVELSYATERELRTSWADLSRLETDFVRRQAIAVSDQVARLERLHFVATNDAKRRRVESLSGHIDEMELKLHSLNSELERRGIIIERIGMIHRELSEPTAEALFAAQNDTAVAASSGPEVMSRSHK